MGEEQKKVIQRIAKLLARTEARGATRPEAEACVALAHRLMLKHGIDAAELNEPDEPVKRVLWHGARRPVEMAFVSALVAKHFNVKAMSFTNPGVKVEFLLGRPHHVKIAEHVWHYLVRTFARLWADHRRRHGRSRGAKLSYCEGMFVALHERLSQQARRAAEANTEARNALVRIGSDLQRMVGQVFGPDVRIRQSRAPTGPFDEAAAIAGMIDSGQVQLHDALGVA